VAPPPEPPARRPAVLLAEHEPEVAELARRYLARAGLDVTVAATPQETIAALSERPAAPAPAALSERPAALAVAPAVAVAVLDLTMPDLDARRLRRLLAPRETSVAAVPMPAIYLLEGTMRPRDARAGADQCLHRPFSPRLLVARVLSALPSPAPPALHDRRGFSADRADNPRPCPGPGTPGPGTPGPGTAGVSGLALDAATRRVRIVGRDITLTPAEFALLSALAAHAGRVLTRDQLQAMMRRPSSGRAVDVYVAQLRAKLPVPGPIRTVRGIGYVLDGPPRSPREDRDG
jgi:DNA-binding response OmpR family regulator